MASRHTLGSDYCVKASRHSCRDSTHRVSSGLPHKYRRLEHVWGAHCAVTFDSISDNDDHKPRVLPRPEEKLRWYMGIIRIVESLAEYL